MAKSTIEEEVLAFEKATGVRRAGRFYDSPGLDMQAMRDPKTGAMPPGEAMTDQSQKDASDMNLIVAKAVAGGFVDDIFRKPFWPDIDVTGVPDYHTAQNLIAEAQEAFMKLDPKIRAQFNNDPGALLDFINDDRNYQKAVDIGLIPPKAAQASGSAPTPPGTPPPAASGGPVGAAAVPPAGGTQGSGA